MKSMVIIFLLLLLGTALMAQEGNVVLRNAEKTGGKPTIQVKLLYNGIYLNEGAMLYRREAGEANWTPLHIQPLTRARQVPAAEIQRDPTLSSYVEAIQTTPYRDLTGMLKITMLLKSIQSPAFARYLGIMYDDSTVVAGKTYEYRAMILKSKKEVLLNVSEPLTVGDYQHGSPPQGIELKAKDRNISIRFQPDEKRLYAFNVYRSSTEDPQKRKLNEIPVLINQVQNQRGEVVYPEVFYSDDSLKSGVVYQYQIAGLDFFGSETRWSEEITGTPLDLTPPLSPVDLRQEVNNLDVTLSWQKRDSEDLAGFHVYRSAGPDALPQRLNAELLPATATSYTDRTPQARGYYYHVAAVDLAKNEGKSERLFVEVKDIVPPSQPRQLRAVADTAVVRLSWQKNPEVDVKGYSIYRKLNTEDDKSYLLLNASLLPGTQYIDRLPRNVKNRFLYKIVAVDSAYNRSPYSEVVAARLPDVTPPAQPLIRNAIGRDNVIIVEWLANVDVDLNGYTLYRSDEADSNRFAAIHAGLLPGNALSYTDRTVKADTRYLYYLTAADSSGNVSVPSKRFAVRVAGTETALAKPENAKAVYSKQKKAVTISWQMKTDQALQGYVLYRQTDSQPMKPLTGMLSERTYVDKNLLPGKTYSYEIRAYHPSGSVAKSSIIQTAITE